VSRIAVSKSVDETGLHFRVKENTFFPPGQAQAFNFYFLSLLGGQCLYFSFLHTYGAC
jgi:hypothetical protein